MHGILAGQPCLQSPNLSDGLLHPKQRRISLKRVHGFKRIGCAETRKRPVLQRRAALGPRSTLPPEPVIKVGNEFIPALCADTHGLAVVLGLVQYLALLHRSRALEPFMQVRLIRVVSAEGGLKFLTRLGVFVEGRQQPLISIGLHLGVPFLICQQILEAVGLPPIVQRIPHIAQQRIDILVAWVFALRIRAPPRYGRVEVNSRLSREHVVHAFQEHSTSVLLGGAVAVPLSGGGVLPHALHLCGKVHGCVVPEYSLAHTIHAPVYLLLLLTVLVLLGLLCGCVGLFLDAVTHRHLKHTADVGTPLVVQTRCAASLVKRLHRIRDGLLMPYPCVDIG